MRTIAAARIQSYVARRRHVITVKNARPATKNHAATPAITRLTSTAQVNRELTTLKRMFNVSIEKEKLRYRPTIKLLAGEKIRKGS